MPSPAEKDPAEWQRYAGMTIRFLVSIGLSVWMGFKLDKWLDWRIPVFIWLLPLLVITGLIISIIRDHSNK